MNGFSLSAKLCAVAISTAVAVFAWTGCSDDHDDDHSHTGTDGGAHSSPYPACGEITAACHEVDVEEGPIHQCHDQAHAAKSNNDCVPIKDNCLKICNEAKADGGGAAHGDGGEEEEHDGGH